jgi:UDP-N-acetylglucosamine transferase subunit ALG13
VIFVTIGSMFPFDRLVRAMDAYAAETGEACRAQIGAGAYEPAHMDWERSLAPADYARAVAACDLVVAHAGMGSVITAGEHGKPIVLLPRRARLGEHTNDHQLDTAAWLGARPGVAVAGREADLAACIAQARADGAGARVARKAPEAFLARLRAFALG